MSIEALIQGLRDRGAMPSYDGTLVSTRTVIVDGAAPTAHYLYFEVHTRQGDSGVFKYLLDEHTRKWCRKPLTNGPVPVSAALAIYDMENTQ